MVYAFRSTRIQLKGKLGGNQWGYLSMFAEKLTSCTEPAQRAHSSRPHDEQSHEPANSSVEQQSMEPASW
jgi:hypothetical protein